MSWIRAWRSPTVPYLLPAVLLALLVVLAAPLWPWSRGWGWPLAGMLAMGLATLLVFSWSVVPE